jgi:hypothetical protein
VYVESGLIELRSNDLVSLVKGKTDKGNYWAQVEITEAGADLVKALSKKGKLRCRKSTTDPLSKTKPSIEQNSNLANYPNSKDANSFNSKNTPEGEKEKETYTGVENMLGTTPMDPDDLAAEIAKDKERKKKQTAEEKSQNYQKRKSDRENRSVKDWSPADTVNYFAQQCNLLWHIKEFRVDRAAFVSAVKNFRDTFDTDGVLEKELIDRYFDSIKHDTKKNDGEVLWKTFIKYAPLRVEEIRRDSVAEDLEAAETVRASRKGL